MGRRRHLSTNRRHKPLVEHVDARILYSADPVSAELLLSENQSVVKTEALTTTSASENTLLLDNAEGLSLTEIEAQLAELHTSTEDTETQRSELIVINDNIDDYRGLLDSLNIASDTNYKVLLLDSNEDGFAQLEQALSGISAVDAIHLFSHGDSGSFQLGSTELTHNNLNQFQNELAALGDALTAEGDLLIYGCQVAAGDDGAALIEQLASLTQADIAASVDDTGDAEQGGNWELEISSGVIEAMSLAASDWQSTLLQTNSGSWTVTGTTATTTIDGITVTLTFTPVSSNSDFQSFSSETLNSIDAFTNNADGDASIKNTFYWDTTKEDNSQASDDGGYGTITLTFSEAVTNPVLHLDRLGGVDGPVQNGAILTLLTSGVELVRLSGTDHFAVDSATGTIQNSEIDQSYSGSYPTSTGESSLTANAGSAAGSVMLEGTLTTATFRIEAAPGSDEGAGGDGLEYAVSLDAPVSITAPASETTNEDTAVVFSSGNSNQITISDSNASSTPVEVSLSVTQGALTLNGTTGLSFDNGDGSSDTTMTFRGTLTDINNALNGLSYTPTANYSGSDTLLIESIDSTLIDLNIDASLEGWYAFDDSGDIGNDNSPAGSNDAIVTGATSTTDGTRGEVISLDGDDYLTISGTFSDPANVTLSAWVNVSSVDTNGGEIISLGNNTGFRITNTGELFGWYWDGGWKVMQSSGANLIADGWHHVAYVYDDSNNVHKLYINGAEVASATASNAISYTLAANTTIGTHADGATNFDYIGQIDDARVYSRALTQVEIMGLVSEQGLTDSTAVALTINSENDAPVLSNSNIFTLTNISEDLSSTSNNGTTVATMIASLSGDRITDADSGAVEGIAVTSVDNSNGIWWYSINGGTTWSSFSAQGVSTSGASDSSSVLLDSDDLIRFTPNTDYNGSAGNISFRAWDTTVGSSGNNSVSVASNGGSSAYSSATGSATLNVTAVNDAPINTLPASYAASEDTPITLTGISIADIDAASGTVAVTLAVSGGTLTATSGGSVTVTGSGSGRVILSGTVSNLNSYLASGSAPVFTPTADFHGTVTLAMATDDGGNTGTGGYLTDTDLSTITVSSVADLTNDSASTNEDNAVTISVLSNDAITNGDAAITAVDGNAITAGGAAVSVTGGEVTLNGSGQLIYTPDADYYGSPSFTYTVTTWAGGTGVMEYQFHNSAPTSNTVDNIPTTGGTTGIATNFNVNALALALTGDGNTYGVIYTGALDITTADTYTFRTNSDDGSKLWIDGVEVVDNDGAHGQQYVSGTYYLSAGRHAVEVRFYEGSGSDSLSVDYSGADTSNVVTGLFASGALGSATTETATVNLTVNSINDAPVLDNSATLTLTTITEDDTSNSGDTVASILASAGGDRITDVDTSASEGIAITARNNGNGQWQYSIDGGSSWSNVGTVSETQALLLRATDLLRFLPNADNGTSKTLDFRAWDQTSGSAGSKVDVTSNGGITAFSSATESAGITVTSVNDAPTLSNGATQALTGTDEDTASSGTLVSGILTGVSHADVDNSASSGIAVTTTTGNGTWEYYDGVGWTAFGSVSATNALLLSSSSQVRYVPDSVSSESAQFDFIAWDQTTGSASSNGSPQYADTSTAGGTTAFSTESASATMTVSDVNDAPIFLGDSQLVNGTFNTDYSSWVIVNNPTYVSVSNGELRLQRNSAVDQIITGLTIGQSYYLSFELSDTSTTVERPVNVTLTGASTLLDVDFLTGVNEPASGYTYRFVADATSVTLLLSDQSSAGLGTRTIFDNVSIAQSASSQTAINYIENSAPISITSLMISGDVDDTLYTGATVQITSGFDSNKDVLGYTLTGSITGSYNAATGILTLNGSGTVAEYNDVLRSMTFSNSSDDLSTATRTITFTVNDGTDTGAFSRDINVTAINDAPTLTATATDPSFTEGDAAVALFSGTAVDAIEAADKIQQLEFTVSNLADGADEFIELDGSSFSLTHTNSGTTTGSFNYSVVVSGSTATVTVTHAGATAVAIQSIIDSLSYQNSSEDPTGTTRVITLTSIQDTGGMANTGIDTTTLNIASTTTLSAINDTPTTSGIADLTVLEDAVDSVIDLTTAFADIETSDADLIYSITSNSNAALFNAVTIDNSAESLTLDYAANANGSATLVVRATDAGGLWVEDTFVVNVTAVNDAPQGIDSSVSTAEDTDFVFSTSDFAFTDIDGSGFQSIDVDTLPVDGILFVDNDLDGIIDAGESVVAGDTINGPTINAGKLIFRPTSGENGSPYASFDFRVRDDDGTSNGGANEDPTANVMTLNVTSVNDAPTLTTTASNPSFTENGSAAGLFTGTSVDTIESGQTVETLTFTVSNVSDGASEIINIDGSAVVLSNGNTATTSGNAYGYSVSLSGSTATVTLTTNSATTADIQALVDGLSYENSSDNPTTSNRIITLTSIQDSGGIANGGADTNVLSISSTVTLNAVNDNPLDSGSLPTDITVLEDVSTSIDLSSINLSDVDANSADLTLTITAGNGTLSAAADVSIDFTGTTTGEVVMTGSLTELNAYLDNSSNLNYLHNTANTFGNDADTLTLVVNDNGNTGSGGGSNISLGSINVDINAVNDRPTGSDNSVTASEYAYYVFNASDFTFTDVEGDTLLSVTFDSLPGNGTLFFDDNNNDVFDSGEEITLGEQVFVANINNGAVQFINDANDNGSAYASFSFTVRDSGGATGGGNPFDADSNVITIDVTATNDAPTVDNAIANQTATEDAAFSFQFAANTFGDVDGDTLSYSTSALPSWLSFNDSTRTFSGTPANADVGTVSITVTADDGNGSTISDSFDVTVNNTNDAPTVDNAIADQTATEDATFSFQFAANTFGDVDGDTLSYSTSALPSWLSFNDSTRSFSGTPINADVGTITITVTADDGNGSTVSDSFDITVNNTNDTPTVDNAIANQTAIEDAAFNFQFAANTFGDVDGDTLSYTTSALPSWLSFNDSTRTFSGTPVNADVGTVSITVTANDGNSSTISDSFDITINNTNDAPTVDNAIVNQTATEDAAFSFQFATNTFGDVDGDTLTYSTSALPSWLSFNDSTRTFSGTPANADVGTVSITVTADDGNGSTISDSFDVTVNNTNDAPTIYNAIANQTATEDSAFSFQFAANTFGDVDGDTLSYTTSALPSWLSFDDSTRSFSGTPLNADVGTITITVTADDGNGSTISDSFNLTVNNTNDAPTVDNAIANQTATEDSSFSFQFAANTFGDVDGDTLSYSTSALPTWLSFNDSTRSFSGTPANADVGTITITVTADDGNGSTISDSFDVTVNNTNDAPTVDNAITNQTATEDSAFNFQFAANTFGDVDGDTLSYSTSALPTWLSFNDSTRSFSGTPINADVGTITITVTADDGNGSTVSDSFDVTVNNTNDTPTVDNAITNQTATEDSAFSFQFAANTFGDIDGDTLTYSTSALPSWLSFDNSTRRFSGTPVNADVGTITVTMTADDGNSSTVTDSFDLTVNNTNDAPTVDNSIPDQTATEDSAFSFQFAANTFGDVDGDTLTYSTSALPSWLSFNDSTRSFSGTPVNADVGTVTITVTADDGNGSTISDSFDITINNTNDAPTVDNAITDQTATEDSAFNFQFAANTFGDVDGDTLSYSTSALPAWLSFNDSTRSFSGTPANADVGTVSITVTAADGNGSTISDSFDITINNTNDAPTVDNAITDQTATEDSAFSFQFAANTFGDVDGDTLSYTTSALPTWLSFNDSTRSFSGTPINADVGTVSITVTADDGNGSTISDSFDLTVNNTNDAPTVDNPIPDQTATEDSAFSFQFAANTFGDVDGDTLSYSTSALPSWLSFDNSTRSFSGTPVNADVGTTTITVTADDGNGSTISDSFDLTVNNTNDAPTVDNAIADQTATEDSAFSFQFAANTFGDVDGDTLSYTTSTLPTWLSFNDSTSTFSGTPENADVGTVSITVTANDGNGSTISDSFDLTVNNTNDAPTVDNAIADQTATEDSAFSFQFAANTFGDVDGDTLSYTTSALPTWLSFNDSTRSFSGTPVNADVGTVTITVTADDGNGSTISDSFNLTVNNTNDAPTVENAITNQTATEDSAFSFQFAANTFGDVDGDTLSYSTSALPSWLSFDNSTRSFSGTPVNADVGTISITVTADDGNGSTVTDSFDLTINNTNDAPTVDNAITDQTATEDSAFSFQFAANTFGDVDGDTLSYTTSALPTWLSFNDSTRSFSGTPENADVGTITITVTADDGNGSTVSDSFDVTVNNTNDAPTIDNAIADQTATEDSAFSFQFAANTFGDVDGDTLSYSTSALPSWLSFNDSTRGFSGTPVNADVGTTTITVTADDGNGSTISDSFDLTVNNTNDAPTVDNAITNQTATEDSVFSFQFAANTFGDVDGDTLTYSTSALPSWLSFDNSTRSFSGTPVNADVGTISITVTADDGNGSTVTDSFDLTINNTNDAPTVDNAITDQTATEDSAFSFQFAANTFGDVDGDTLSYTTSALPTWLSFNDSTRSFSGTPENADVGTITITVTADDGNGSTVSDSFDVTVNNTNDAPTIDNAIADQTATEDSAFSFQFAANTFGDVDGDTLTYTTSALPSWLSFDDSTRSFSGTPVNADVGTITITVTADDGNGSTIFDSFNLTVNNTNDAPTADNVIANQTATEDSAFNFQFAANTFGDVDGDTLSYSTSALPSWLSFDDSTRNFSGTPANADVGTVTITVTADDGNGSTVSDSFDLTVNNTNDAPVISGGSALSAFTETNATLINSGTFTVTDVDQPDTVTAIVDSVIVSGSGSGSVPATLNNTTLLSYLTVSPSAILDSAETSDTLTWDFNSGTEAFDFLANGEILTLSYGITVSDSQNATASETVTITITGTNDSAVFSGDITGTVMEDQSIISGNITTSGQLNIDDKDNGQQYFPGDVITASYGSLVLDSSGYWTYTAYNNQTDLQQLADGESLTDTLTVHSADNTTQDITITLNGVNDAPQIIGSDDNASLIETDSGLLVTGNLTIQDTDLSNTVSATITAVTTSGSATLPAQFNEPTLLAFISVSPESILNATSSSATLTWSFDSAGENFNFIAANENLTLQYTLTVTDSSGATASRSITVTITGSNDSADIQGNNSGAVTEDISVSQSIIAVSGNLTISDADFGEDTFIATTLTGNYGALSIDANGNWHYQANNSQAVIQQLDQNESLLDSFSISAADGTTHIISITLHGSEDQPIISGAFSAAVTEDSQLIATGTLAISDTDSTDNPVSFADISSTISNNGYGSFSLFNGTWQYQLNNLHPDVQSLDVSETLIDTISFTATDGSEQVITVTINGDEDAAIISGTFTGIASEDGTVITTGHLNIDDTDNSDNPVFTDINNVSSDSGYGAFSLFNNGDWTYTLDNTHASIQALDHGESLSDSYTFTASDGTAQVVTITILGNEDDAVISGSYSGTVQEDDNLIASGSLSINDTDSSDTPYFTELSAAATAQGYGHIDLINNQWIFTLNNSLTVIQQLDAGDVLFDSYTFIASDGSQQTIALDIRGSEDAPTGLAGSVTLDEDSQYYFSLADFNFSDIDGDNLAGIQITVLPNNGTLQLNDDVITQSQFLSRDQLENSEFSYTPQDNANGEALANFSYQLFDGELVSVQSMTMTLNVAAVDDAPVIQAPVESLDNTPGQAIPVLDSSGEGLSLLDFDSSDGLERVTITVAEGELSLSSMIEGLVISGQNTTTLIMTGSSDAINTALTSLSYLPKLGFSGSMTLSITAQDVLNNSEERLGLSTTTDVELLINGSPSYRFDSDTQSTKTSHEDNTINIATISSTEDQRVMSTGMQRDTLSPMATSEYHLASLISEHLVKRQQMDFLNLNNETMSDDNGHKFISLYREYLNSLRISSLNHWLPEYDPNTLPYTVDLSALGSLNSIYFTVNGNSDINQLIIRFSSAAFSIGTIIWLMRGGSLLASMLMSYPAWRSFDPLPIFIRDDEEDEEKRKKTPF